MWRLAGVFLLSISFFGSAQGEYERGLEVYKGYYCGLCHQSSAAGTEGIFGPTHDALAEIAAARLLEPGYEGEATDAEGYIRESTIQPERYVVPDFTLARHRMPAYTHMSEEELSALIYFLLHQEAATP